MEVKKNPRNTTEWQKRTRAMKAYAKKNNLPCWICGEAILFDVEYTHPLSFTADHEEELAAGGSLLRGAKLHPAHRSCNSKRSNTREARERQGRTVAPTKRKVVTHRLGNVSERDFTAVAPNKKAKPDRYRTRTGVLTTIDWDGTSTPLYRK
ncbi:hypothetical protein G9E11_12230 [Arthrobacter sp. IA7]|uniref:hypothetical protein n=1 Tax=Arthrobacter ipis TaxID=2716202 RepID=UPI00168A3E8C|nr:hypothetical protein [Arthrobacter ipis]MBD1542999.1 hypothetical protein [Arthrobacter ipis]